ncbi:MAG TPA: class I SAM-dependent methyltransferase [Terrimicrobiaceae bacterium]|nr:class I SAM-dependent methyltransferase [Terrimicrobiaceae bacterium]
MTEWDASEYARISGLQEAMAEEVLSLLDLKGAKRVLDVGCGNGKVTAEIASGVPQGSVLGVDSSADMIAFALSRFGPRLQPNLRFEIADARRLTFGTNSIWWSPSTRSIGYTSKTKPFARYALR